MRNDTFTPRPHRLRPGPSLHGWLAGLGGLLALGLSFQSTALAQTVLPVKPKWTGSAAAGLTLTKGNSDTLLFTLTGRTGKKWDMNELSFGADAAYGENNGEENNETIGGFGQYNRLFTDRWYGFGRAEALHDGMAGVDYRVTLSVGLGYYFIKNTNTTFSLEAGPGYVIERQQGTGTNGVSNNNYVTFRVAEKFVHKFNSRSRIWQSLEFLPQVDDVHNFNLNGEIGVEADLTKTWSLRLVLLDTYDNEPAPGRENNDIKLIGGIAWNF